jgi:homoserine dehydrogenase
MAQPVRVALLGCGTVGSAVVRLMHQQAEDLTARIGAPLELVGVAVRRPNRDRGDLGLDRSLFTADALSLVKRDDVDIVVEVVGGIEPARTWLTEALRAGKSVVTGNKALLAEDGGTIHDAAAEGDADLYYEAAVAGAIPLLRPLRESLHGDRITRVTGIVNGTTNFILSAMDASGMGFEEALEQATELGYAEPDPTADIEGFDAAAKAAILASLAFHTRVTAADVYREGITEVTATDMASAHTMGATIKLLCIATRTDGGGVAVRVHPAMIPKSHPLASVVLGDIVAVARNRIAGHRAASESSYAALPVRPMGEVWTRYHVSLDVADRAGVLAAVANVFARQGVSIATVRQSGRDASAQLVIVTHTAPDAALRATVEDLRALDIVRSVASVLRVEGESSR